MCYHRRRCCKAADVVHSTCSSAPRKDGREEAVQLSLKSARACSDTSPCTNIVLKCIFCPQETFIWKYGMVDHVTRCHPTDTALEAGTERATIFKQGYTVSESEKRKVLTKDKIGAPRSRRGNNILPSGVRRRVSGNGGPGDGTTGARASDEEEEEEEEEGEGEGAQGGGRMRRKRRKRRRRGAETEVETETTTKSKRKKKKKKKKKKKAKRKKKKKKTKKETKTKMKTRRGKGVKWREGEGRVNGHGWGVGGVASYA